MFKQIILLLLFTFITVNASSTRIRRQFGSEQGYHRQDGPSYRPSFGGNAYGGRGGSFDSNNFGRGGFGANGNRRHGGDKIVITEFVRGK